MEAAKLLTVKPGLSEEAREVRPLVGTNSNEGRGQMADPFQELPAQLFRAAEHYSCLALTLLAKYIVAVT